MCELVKGRMVLNRPASDEIWMASTLQPRRVCGSNFFFRRNSVPLSAEKTPNKAKALVSRKVIISSRESPVDTRAKEKSGIL